LDDYCILNFFHNTLTHTHTLPMSCSSCGFKGRSLCDCWSSAAIWLDELLEAKEDL